MAAPRPKVDSGRSSSRSSSRLDSGRTSSRAGNKATWIQKSSPDQVKKIELLRELDQLEKKIAALEREKQAHVYSKRSEFRQDYTALEELESKTVSDRKNEKVKVRGQLEKMRSTVDKFQHQLQNVKPTPEFVEKLKETMEDIESVIDSFKDQQRTIYEELMIEEKTLWQEISALENRYESWAQALPITIPVNTKTSTKPQPVSSARNAMASMPPEVAAFERFLQQTGGHRGGWDEYDHGTFMRIRNKYKGRPLFMDEAAVSLPGRDMIDVKCHENWYQEYTTLLQRKKDGIQKWRLVKEAQKDELMSNVGRDEEEQEETAQRKAELKAKKMEEERREKYEKLNAWKVQRELEKAEEEERKLEEEYKKARKHDMERQRKMEEKSRVQMHIQQRKEEDLLRQMEQERRRDAENEEKRRGAAQERVRFLERDRRLMEERLAREKAKEEEEKRKKQRLQRLKSQVEVQAKRDPTRLYQLTAGWKERKKDTASAGNGPVLHIPHRAVPSWRGGPS
ncbi:coiled-coil domain-containing protein 112 [Strongylocentrotus purpuratus]|uniref:Coiled-coil domain-containing protein 112 n=1 Tax=Strongylocentrotus purpuratus TaxID=7668 RepID=A0A7M7SUR9_STRPU|nr:coiled-coil domain-containing protein 112 [Strongylocentrotus purpuratus]